MRCPELVCRDGEVENQSISGDRVSSALEPFLSYIEELYVVREADISRRVFRSVGTTHQEMMVREGVFSSMVSNTSNTAS